MRPRHRSRSANELANSPFGLIPLALRLAAAGADDREVVVRVVALAADLTREGHRTKVMAMIGSTMKPERVGVW